MSEHLVNVPPTDIFPNSLSYFTRGWTMALYLQNCKTPIEILTAKQGILSQFDCHISESWLDEVLQNASKKPTIEQARDYVYFEFYSFIYTKGQQVTCWPNVNSSCHAT